MSDNGDSGAARQAWEQVAAIRGAAELDARRIEAMTRRLRDWRANDITAPTKPGASTEASTAAPR